ncbi:MULTISPECIES: hypothetical protein [Mycobacteriaceae]|uniref:Uncharacterized protein n=2 Tax=Mycolicibacterium TaxID=1866885 RepID=A0ABT6GY22_MYCGU|nr:MULTISPECIES: hypothetical protein [Mycobacteriaceae]MDG5486036.1 hypothetical protein [Mycolicibacterium gadium]MDX1882561.1 hypothetical protein [Mycolicibacterium sp. 120270]SEH54677.1 hypothetical protein SAMN04489835_1270 [Mycolicibacterium rutilum]
MTDDEVDPADASDHLPEAADVFDGPEDPERAADRDRIADELLDPGSGRAKRINVVLVSYVAVRSD